MYGRIEMAINTDALRAHIDAIPPSITSDLQRQLTTRFDKCGLYYRVFSRCKSAQSTLEKMKLKKYDESADGKKMQDIIGVRVALYFKDDIEICRKIIEDNYTVLEVVQDEETSKTFGPMKLNIVCKMPETICRLFDSEIWSFPIDQTFEVQIRTIFSEGWHEIEHDMRYKNQSDWISHKDLARNLNGIFATLETCDWAILNVLDALAYQKYKSKDWEAMLRNHLRIRMACGHLSARIKEIMDSDSTLAKELFRVDRANMLLCLSHEQMHRFPLTMDNIVFFLNEWFIQNSEISKLTPLHLKESLQSDFKQIVFDD